MTHHVVAAARLRPRVCRGGAAAEAVALSQASSGGARGAAARRDDAARDALADVRDGVASTFTNAATFSVSVVLMVHTSGASASNGLRRA